MVTLGNHIRTKIYIHIINLFDVKFVVDDDVVVVVVS